MKVFSLFSGIGGFDIAAKNLGWEIVGACEIDKYAREITVMDSKEILQKIKDGENLRGVDLRGADLSDADLSDADLSGADLSGADLSDAYLRGVDLRNAYLSDAYLRGADLRGAKLSGANLRNADLQGIFHTFQKEIIGELILHVS